MYKYDFYVADYAAATRYLSRDHDLAYRRLLDLYYLDEKPIPLNVEVAARKIGFNSNSKGASSDPQGGVEDINVVQWVLSEFFLRTPDGWHQKRADEELNKVKKAVVSARESGKKGGQASAQARLKGASRVPQATVNLSPSPSYKDLDLSLLPTSSAENKSLQEEKALVRSVPADHCPHHEIISLYHEILPMCPTVKDWHEARRTALRSRWKEHPSLNWWRGYFEHVAKSDFLIGEKEASNGRIQFVASLEWLTKRGNLTKVHEGNYHE